MAPEQKFQEREPQSEDTRFKTETRQPVGKVIELIGHSTESFEDAVQRAVSEAAKTIDHISGVDVRRTSCKVRDGEIVEYVVDLKLAFGIDSDRHR